MSEPTQIQNSNHQTLQPLLIFVCLAVGVLWGAQIKKVEKDKFTQIIDIVESDYVDSSNGEYIREASIKFLLSQLDPHSTYIPSQLSEISSRQIKGEYDGLGIEYFRTNDTLFVYDVLQNSPANKSGIFPGDRLLKINNKDVVKEQNDDSMRSLLQNKEMMLFVYRKSNKQLYNINVKKAPISMNSSKSYYMMNETLGYIKIERFSSQTHQEFMVALNELKAKGMKELLLDLRDNGGGLLSESVAIANEFLEKDALITFTEGHKRLKKEYFANGKGGFISGKLILLINQNTASASEILAGALQDNDRAVLIGSRSFGKGLVQEPFRLSDGSLIRLTTARYYTPSGRSIQRDYDQSPELYRLQIFNRDILADTLNPILDSSSLKEFFSKNGRLLTPGGGLRPDLVYTSTQGDSIYTSGFVQNLEYTKVLKVFVLDHMQSELNKIKKQYNSPQAFFYKYQLPNKYINQVLKQVKKNKHFINYQTGIKNEQIIKEALLLEITFRIFGETGRNILANKQEGVYSKTLEVLKKYNTLLNIKPKNTRRFDY
jgi:carboxyl-terminal processing protease